MKREGVPVTHETGDVQVIAGLITEVWTAHRDPKDANYNECEKAECAWCEQTRKALESLASQPAPSGWQQVIEEMRKDAREWRGVDPVNNRTARQLERYANRLESLAAGQNAVDALPPAPDATVKCSHCGDGGVIPTKDGPFCATCYHPLAASASPAKEERYPLLWERGETIRSVPIDLARRAYEGYSKAYGTQQSFERLRERGGFGPSEMDRFVPGWRDDPRVKEADALSQGTAMTPKERRRILRVAEGLKMALTFAPRELLDTAVRESIKELRAIAAEPDDPIRAAVDDVLDPVRDAVVQFGQKLAKGDHAWTPDATGTACAACGGSPSEHDGGEVVVACDCGNRDTITLPLTAMPPCSGGCGRRMRIVGIYREVMA